MNWNHLAILAAGLPALHASALGDNSSPSDKPEQYQAFCQELQRMQQEQSRDFYDACNIVYQATQNECAIDEWMQAAAGKGLAPAQLYIANRRIEAIFIHQDSYAEIQEHLQLLQGAAKQGYIPAILYRSTCLSAGLGQAPNPAQALKILEPACKQGSMEAIFKHLQLSGKLRSIQDLERKEVKAAIEGGNPYVMMYASMLTKDQDIRLQNLQEAAELGNADAYYALGSTIADTNPKQSYALMLKAAELHHPDALAIVGGIEASPLKAREVLNKTGAEFKPEEGYELIKMASMLGSTLANTMLGESYYSGNELIAPNKERAFYHFERATCGSDGNAAIVYTYMLMEGIGCTAQPAFALELCRALLSRNIKQAVLLYAYAHYKGLGTEADAAQAAEILQEAATLQQPEAYIYLAYITDRGGAKLEPKPERAQAYLRMAELDLKEKAQHIYKRMQEDGEWIFKPES